MGTTVYVDVLLVINYIINLLLLLCTTKWSGESPKRRKIVAAAVFGSLCSLTIFLPFLGFFPEILLKIGVSAAIVRIAMPWRSRRVFLGQWFLFFAVNFFFAGIMLALWMTLTPKWLTYYNGIVYFDISTGTLLGATVAAYMALTAVGKILRKNRVQQRICPVQIYLDSCVCVVNGLMDTGNTLTEPFSGEPVVICQMKDILPLLPPLTATAVQKGVFSGSGLSDLEIPIRLIPYTGVGVKGVLPAFRPDRLVLRTGEEIRQTGAVYVALSPQAIGDGRYNAILNPEMILIKTTTGGAKQ